MSSGPSKEASIPYAPRDSPKTTSFGRSSCHVSGQEHGAAGRRDAPVADPGRGVHGAQDGQRGQRTGVRVHDVGRAEDGGDGQHRARGGAVEG
jgi:hypothetical protein